MDPEEVRAAVIDQNGTMTFVNGSVTNPDENLVTTGAGFSRTPYKGFESHDVGLGTGVPPSGEGNAYILEENEFGLPEDSTSLSYIADGTESGHDKGFSNG